MTQTTSDGVGIGEEFLTNAQHFLIGNRKRQIQKTSPQVLAEITGTVDTEKVELRAYGLLNSLEPDHMKGLMAFCQRELFVGCRLAGAAGELLLKDAADLLHDAIESILQGIDNPRRGYHPRAEDVENLDTFIPYIRTVVREIRRRHAASAALRAHLFARPIVGKEPIAFSHSNPSEEAELGDLKEEFFKTIRLELTNPEKFAEALEAWCEDFFNIDHLTLLGLNSMDTYHLKIKSQLLYFRLSKPFDAHPN
jgi:hypothetical protein